MKDLKADIWFPTLVWHKMMQTDLDVVTRYALTLRDNTKGTSLSNYGGWQSENVVLPLEHVSLLIELDQTIKACCQQAGLPPLKLYNSWFCVNNYGDYNTVHNHQGSILSGVLYLNVPDDKCGEIEFYRDDESNYYLPTLEKYNNFTSQKATYKPEKGKLLIFPGWLKHAVQGSRSQGERVSMSFNYGVRT